MYEGEEVTSKGGQRERLMSEGEGVVIMLLQQKIGFMISSKNIVFYLLFIAVSLLLLNFYRPLLLSHTSKVSL